MRQYSFLNESVGRDLIGASSFASRKNTVQQIIQKYPNPQSLADALQASANESYGKEKENLLNLSLKCRGLTQEQYPSFVKGITGFSKIWKYLGIGAAGLAVAGASKYVMNQLDQQKDPDANWKDGAQGVVKNAAQDINKGVQKIPGLKNTTVFKDPSKFASNTRHAVGSVLSAPGKAASWIDDSLNKAYRNKVSDNISDTWRWWRD